MKSNTPLILTMCLLLPAIPGFASPLTAEKCKKIEQDKARLACYDEAFLTSNATKDPQKIEAIKEFGLEHIIDTENRQTEIVAVVSSVKADPYGKLKVSLDNGQVWKQKESKRIRLKKGDKITIRRGAFGSFNLQKEGQGRVIKVKRLK